MSNPNIIVPKTDDLAILREMVERVEGEINSLQRNVSPEAKDILTEDAHLLDRLNALNERVKALDKIGNTPGQRTFLAGGTVERNSQASWLGRAITAARRVARGQRLGEDYAVFKRVQTEGTDTAGGVTIPTETAAEVIKFVGELSLARRLGRVIPMASDTLILPIDNGEHTAYWPSEGVAMTDSSVAFKAAADSTLNASTCAVINKISKELSEDSLVLMENYLGEYASETIAAEENKQMLVGTGSPFTGIKGASGVGSVTMSGRPQFSMLTFADLAAAEFAVDQQVFGNMSWVMHKDAFLEAFRLRDSNGYPLFQTSWSSLPVNPAGAGPGPNAPSMLMGSPVYLSKQMDQTGTGKCLAIVGSFKDGFVLGDRSQITVEWDDSIFFSQRQRAILVSERVAMLVAKGTAFGKVVTG